MNTAQHQPVFAKCWTGERVMAGTAATSAFKQNEVSPAPAIVTHLGAKTGCALIAPVTGEGGCARPVT